MTTTTNIHPPKSAVFGPYSQWPRRPKAARRVAYTAGGAAGLAVFLHCVVPMIIGA